MWLHRDLDDTTPHQALQSPKITLAGHRTPKIYGTLARASGNRMKRENRVFLASEAEAIALGFRPCGHCLKEAYRAWICSTR